MKRKLKFFITGIVIVFMPVILAIVGIGTWFIIIRQWDLKTDFKEIHDLIWDDGESISGYKQ